MAENAPGDATASPTPNTARSSASAQPATSEVPSMKDLNGIKYTGYASERTISAADLKSAGIDHDKDLVWNADNGFTVESKDLSAAVRDLLLAPGSGFAAV
jgi:hypothetical protein